MFRQSRQGRLLGCALATAATMAAGGAGAQAQIDIMVPAYFYPGVDGNGNGTDDWVDMANAVDSVGVTAIMNPASGSGTSANTDYQSAVSNLRNAGGLVIGYISTQWGARSMSQLQTEVANYINWYDVDGFFFDEMPTSYLMSTKTTTEQEDLYDYYTDLYNHIDQFPDSSYVIGNAGNLTEERFLTEPTVDALVTLENDFNTETVLDPPPTGSSTYSPSSWTTSYDKSEFAVIQHNVASASDMEDIVEDAVAMNFGLIYVTDDSLSTDYNPFDQLPTYWDDLVDAVETASSGGGGGGVPEPATAGLMALGGIALLRRK